MKRDSYVLLFGLSVLFFLICTGAFAGERFNCNGTTPRIVVEEDSQTLPDGRILVRSKEVGFVFDKDPDNPVHGAASTCMGSVIREAQGNAWAGSGVCEEIDADMDVAWSWWEGNQNGGTWGYIRGTGKFEGIKGSGTWRMPVPLFPDARSIGSFSGTMELK